MKLSNKQIKKFRENLKRPSIIRAWTWSDNFVKELGYLADTIESLQQENEQLHAQIARMQEAVQ
jgi:hypothetical protein